MYSKQCSKCNNNKPFSEFYNNAASRDGKTSRCKSCLDEYARSNRDSRKASNKRWRDKNKKHIHEYGTNYYQNNMEKVKKANQAWKAGNSEKQREYLRRWQDANRDIVNEKNRRWKKENPIKAAISWHRRRARLKGNGGSHTALQWKRLLRKYRHTCLCCGKTGITLTVDHIVPVSKGGTNDISNIQPLCASCNSRKGTKTIDYR